MTNVSVFFYGSFIALDVLAQVDYHPTRFRIAQLPGFDIVTRPLATLVPSMDAVVWGILAMATHDELDRLYNRDWVRAYRPHAVVVNTVDGAPHSALCYIAPGITADRPDAQYLQRIRDAARGHQFPTSYLHRLEGLQ